MKIRKGFVSNSSSSSFIVVFDKKPESVEQLKQLMFPSYDDNAVLTEYEYTMSISDVVGRVFRDLTTQNEDNTKDEILSDFRYRYYDRLGDSATVEENAKFHELKSALEIINVTDSSYDKLWKRIDNLREKVAKRDYEKFMKKHKNSYIHRFSYSDNSGEVLLEHYGIFDNLDHIKFSHH